MIKNKLLLILCMGITIQPLFSSKSPRKSSKDYQVSTNNSSTSWLTWGAIAALGLAVVGWFSKQWQGKDDTQKNKPQRYQKQQEEGETDVNQIPTYIDHKHQTFIEEDKEDNKPSKSATSTSIKGNAAPQIINQAQVTPIVAEGEEQDTVVVRDPRAYSYGLAVTSTKKLKRDTQEIPPSFNIYAKYVRNLHLVNLLNPTVGERYNIFELTQEQHSEIAKKFDEGEEFDQKVQNNINENLKKLGFYTVFGTEFIKINVPTILPTLKKIITLLRLDWSLQEMSKYIASNAYTIEQHKKILNLYAQNYTKAFNYASRLSEGIVSSESIVSSEIRKMIQDFINLYFLYYKPIHTLHILEEEKGREKIQRINQPPLEAGSHAFTGNH